MKKLLTLSIMMSFLAVMVLPVVANAATNTIVVTPANEQGWTSTPPYADTRPGGEVNYVNDPTSPAGPGALQLTTDDTNTAKAQYLHAANTPLSQVTELSYYTKQVSGPPSADPSYQVIVDLDNNGTVDTNLVYEPYWNGTVVNGVWQQWDVDSGQFWSSKTVAPLLVNGAGGPPFYTLDQVTAAYPNAVVLGYGVNVGTYNPNYNVETDLFNFNGTVYNFEISNVPTSKDQCKNNGYLNHTDANGEALKNQGKCVSFVSGNKGNVQKNINKIKVNNKNNQNAQSGNASGDNASSGNASNTNNSNNVIRVRNN